MAEFDALVAPAVAWIWAAPLQDGQSLPRPVEDPKGSYRRRFGEELLLGEALTVRHQDDGAAVLYLPRFETGIAIAQLGPADGNELSGPEMGMAAGGIVSRCQGDSR